VRILTLEIARLCLSDIVYRSLSLLVVGPDWGRVSHSPGGNPLRKVLTLVAIAEGFSSNGAKVYITGRRTDVLEKTAKELNATATKGGQVIPYVFCLPKWESVWSDSAQAQGRCFH
jgi:hypothetical protein